MDIKKQLSILWRQKWWVCLFCAFAFIIADHTVIHGMGCGISPCPERPYLEVKGISFLAPTGILSAYVMMPSNYSERSDIYTTFRAGWTYRATTVLVIEDEEDLTAFPYVSDEEADSYLASSFFIHKLRVILSFPLWIALYWLCFVYLRKVITPFPLYVAIVGILAILVVVQGLGLKLDTGAGGGRIETWSYIFGTAQQEDVN